MKAPNRLIAALINVDMNAPPGVVPVVIAMVLTLILWAFVL
jgi:hypothetical protein